MCQYDVLIGGEGGSIKCDNRVCQYSVLITCVRGCVDKDTSN